MTSSKAAARLYIIEPLALHDDRGDEIRLIRADYVNVKCQSEIFSVALIAELSRRPRQRRQKAKTE